MNKNERIYRATGIAGSDIAGAARLRFDLLVVAATGKVSGHVAITRALPLAGGNISLTVTGQVRGAGLGQITQLVALTGTYWYEPSPQEPLSIREQFSAHFAVDAKWQGRGGFSYGGHDVNDVPVRPYEHATDSALLDAFNAILASPASCKRALASPSAVLAEHGIPVPDPKLLDETMLAHAVVMAHLEAGAAGKPHRDVAFCESLGCVACQTKISTSAPTLVAITALAGDPTSQALANALGVLVGLDPAVVINLAVNGQLTPKDICAAKGDC